jgi:hypothetical protein
MSRLAPLSALVLLVGLASAGLSQHYGQPYPCYPGYDCAMRSYYGPLPPYLMGGPAYGYTYPQPWYGYTPYPPGPRSYIVAPYCYQPSVQTHSFYSPMPYSYYPPPAWKANEATTKSVAKKQTYLPGKEPPGSTPPVAENKQSSTPQVAPKKSSLWRRLIYW